VSGHPWSLVAPWYRWPRFAVPPRATPPVLQKYETSRLVDLFAKNPQRSLRFTAEDAVERRRKLFLALHKRFYLVVCELHCDAPGFPNARRDDVCEAGFVVRRRQTPVPAELEAEATRLMTRIGKRRAQLSLLDNRLRRVVPVGAAPGPIATGHAVRLLRAQARAQERLGELRAELAAFAETNELTPALEGWVPSEVEGVGAWRRIDGDGPEGGDEHVFPLYPLTPDPAIRPHAARGRTLYFGLVPTASSDAQADGSARFDERTAYELHCFVRRHDPRCPRRPARRDCRGELTWSAPSEPFTLAAPSDLVGTSNYPVTVTLPDLPELLDQAAKLPWGQGAPLKMKAPAGSSLPVVVDADGKGKPGQAGKAQICSFAIPLITIVAFFVFRLFLPVVVLLFGLWPLLRLRFCIDPELNLGLELDATFEAAKGGVDLEADVEAAEELRGTIKAKLNENMPAAGYGEVQPGDEMTKKETYRLNDLVAWVVEQQRRPDDPIFAPHPSPPAGALPSPNALLAPLIWEEELPVPELPDMPPVREAA
jgi:hypothetical protein